MDSKRVIRVFKWLVQMLNSSRKSKNGFHKPLNGWEKKLMDGLKRQTAEQNL